MARRAVLFLILAGLATGCRNPFSPQADIELSDFLGNEISVKRTTPSSRDASFYFNNGLVQPLFVVKNKVGVIINKVNIVYTDLAGNPVTTYRTTGGKTFRVLWRIPPRFSFATLGEGEGATSVFQFTVLDSNVYTELETQVGSTKALLVHITFYGEDDNGYDVKLTGDLTMKGYDF